MDMMWMETVFVLIEVLLPILLEGGVEEHRENLSQST
jgi:hypothetical protein